MKTRWTQLGAEARREHKAAKFWWKVFLRHSTKQKNGKRRQWNPFSIAGAKRMCRGRNPDALLAVLTGRAPKERGAGGKNPCGGGANPRAGRGK